MGGDANSGTKAGEEFRIFGPPEPGTGKTTTLTRWITRAADVYGPDRVVVASFTKAAAAELGSRGLPLDSRQVGTLHAHAYRMLGTPTIAETKLGEWNAIAGPGHQLTAGGRGGIDEAAVDVVSHAEGDALYMAQQTYRARQIAPDAWPNTAAQVFHRKWTAWKLNMGYRDFTDLIELALALDAPAPGNPAIGFFDEVQDFTRLELALVRSWGKHMDRVVLAGDDDQCIYDFKGATPDAFLDPPLDADHTTILGQSWRVPVAVQELASRWISQVASRQDKPYLPRAEQGEVIGLSPLSGHIPGYLNAGMLLDHAQRFLDAGQTVMFLATCGFMLDQLKGELKARGLPFHNPYRKTRGDWNPLGYSTGKRLSGADRLLAYLRPDAATWGDEARSWTATDMARWTAATKTSDYLVPGALKLLEQAAEYPGELSNDFLFRVFQDGPHLGQAVYGDLDWFRDRLLKARQAGMDYPLRVASRHGGGALRKPPQIILGTIHSVKGGEADVVYLFPDVSQAAATQLHNTDPAVQRQAKDATARLFYVGMTRARMALVLCGPSSPHSVALSC